MSLVKASLLGLVRYLRLGRVIKMEVRVVKSGIICVKPGESKGSTITGSDPLENNIDILKLNTFVCLILVTQTIPH